MCHKNIGKKYNKSEITAKSLSIMDSCLFCASYCHPPKLQPVGVLGAPPGVFITADVGLDEEESSPFSLPPSPSFPPSLEPSQDSKPEPDSAIKNSLKVILILKKILQIPNEQLYQFLTENGGQSNPDSWVHTCTSCGELVTQYYELLKEFSKLQSKLITIEAALKGRIVESKDILATSSIWARIRCQVLKEYLAQLFNQKQDNLTVKKTESVPIKKEDPERTLSSLFLDLNSETESADEKEDEDMRFKSRQSSFTPKFEAASPPLIQNTETMWKSRIKEENSSNFGVTHPHLPLVSRPRRKQDLKIFPNPLNEQRRRTTTRKSATVFISEDNDNDNDNLSSKLTPNSIHLTVSTPKPVILPRSQETFNGITKNNSLEKCEKCPFRSRNKTHFQNHLKTHLEGSKATPCEECGVYILPSAQNLGSHLQSCGKNRKKSPPSTSTSTSAKLDVKSSGDKSFPCSNGNSKYLVEIKGSKRFYKCSHCPYKSTTEPGIQGHLKLHEKGSRAIACEECGYFVLPERLKSHRGAWHATYKTGRTGRFRYKRKGSGNSKRFGKTQEKRRDGVGAGVGTEPEEESKKPFLPAPVFHHQKEKIPVFFQCDICPYKSRHKGQLDTHLEAHREGSGASRCADCGWNIFAGKLDFHFRFCPDPDGKKERSFKENGCEEGGDPGRQLHFNGRNESVSANGENNPSSAAK